jgi:two-component system osmolarity sensor histidine kinase EnvZ
MSGFKDMMPRSLFGRAVLIIVLPLVMVQLVAIWVFYDRVWETVTRRLSQAVAGEIALVVRLYENEAEAEDRRRVLQQAGASLGLIIEHRPGTQLQQISDGEGSGILERLLIAALRERVAVAFAVDVWSHPREVRIDVQASSGVFAVRLQRERLFTTTPVVMILWMVGSSLVFFAVASIFMRNQVRPIQRLAAAAEAFGKGDDDESYRPAGATEVRQAGGAFVVMRERLKRFVQQRTEMLAGISHDLRTPLTRMKLEFALLGDSPSVTGLRADVSDMERMIESYLAFLRGEGEEQRAPTDLAAMLRELVDGVRREGHSVRLVTDGDLVLSVRPQAMKRSLRNLLANATRHGARIDIKAKRRERSVKITIDDDGPGIPPESREDAFKPFYRLDASRSTATGGVGLGLTITRDAVRAHGGEIWLEDSPLGGLRARVKLPV